MPDQEALKHDFFEIEYGKSLEIVHKLHDMRLAYQKFYVSIAGAIISIAILVAHFPPAHATSGADGAGVMDRVAGLMPVETMIGFLFLVCSIVGYVVVRNLVSIRRNEVYWTNFAIDLRDHIVLSLSLPPNYPKLGKSRGIDWSSADFQTLVACSIINVFIALIGTAFFMDGAKPSHLVMLLTLVATMSFFFHLQSVRLAGSPLDRSK